jgi:hypothetical protein
MPFMPYGGGYSPYGGGIPFMPLQFPTFLTIAQGKRRYHSNFFGEGGSSKDFFLSLGR